MRVMSVSMASWRTVLALTLGVLALGCEGEDPAEPQVPTVQGVVVASTTGDPVAGAEVSIGSATAVTGPNGRFELTALTPGPATLRGTATGFNAIEIPVTVPSGTLTVDVPLVRIEQFEFGDFALYVPADVSYVNAVLIALGGPDTRGFATARPFGAPVPQVEEALQALGEDFRTMAADRGLAVLGTSMAALPNGPASDELLLEALEQAAAISGRSELAHPWQSLLLYGMSGGGPQASGFTARNPDRVAGLFLKVPAGMESLAGGAVLEVPTYVVLAEMDAFVDNAALSAAAMANRARGALWAVAQEPGVPHHSLTPKHRSLTVEWMRTILHEQYCCGMGGRARILEIAGWLGNPTTGEVFRWDDYPPGNRSSANWFPTQTVAGQWRDLQFASQRPTGEWRIAYSITAASRQRNCAYGEGFTSTAIFRSFGPVLTASFDFLGLTDTTYGQGSVSVSGAYDSVTGHFEARSAPITAYLGIGPEPGTVVESWNATFQWPRSQPSDMFMVGVATLWSAQWGTCDFTLTGAPVL